MTSHRRSTRPTADQSLAAAARRAPHPALRGLVEDYHGYRFDSLAPGVHHGLPSSTLTVVVSFDEPLDVGWRSDPGSRGTHWAMVSGLHAEPALIHHGGRQHGVQLALTPLGARVLLGAPAGALAGSLVSLQVPQAYDAMAAAGSWGERFDVLDRLLLGRAGRSNQSGRSSLSRPVRGELTHAWQRIQQSLGTVRVADLADEVGWSRRHLTDRFTDEFGVGPKQAARIERFTAARALLSSGRTVADAAVSCGYADQGHLTRDFRALAGLTPTEWRREHVTFVQDEADSG